MRRIDTKRMALSGLLAAFAVVIMCLGGLIPFATYICPMLCCLTQYVVLRFCGIRLAWTWFAVMSILSILFAPDKEAVMVFLFLGYYPLIKGYFDRYKLAIVLKILFFNISILASYAILIRFLGMQDILRDSMEFGVAGLIVILLLGNITFFLLDKLLEIAIRKLR